MGKVLVDFQEIESYKKNNMCGRPGKEGTCYYLTDDIIVKIFHIFVGNKRVYFDDIKNDFIALPIDVYFDSMVKLETAYTMKYLAGTGLINGFPSGARIENVKQAYINLRKVIEEYQDINMYDMCLANILYDKSTNSFRLIDTSRWYPSNNAFSKNIEQFNNCLCYSLFRHNLDWISELSSVKELRELDKLHKLYENYLDNNFPNFQELLDTVSYEIGKKSDKKIKTFGDLAGYGDKFTKKS